MDNFLIFVSRMPANIVVINNIIKDIRLTLISLFIKLTNFANKNQIINKTIKYNIGLRKLVILYKIFSFPVFI